MKMRLVLAPDSFKGSLSAKEFCTIASLALKEALPMAEIHSFPCSDGGEGAIDAILHNLSGERILVNTTDPLGRPIQAAYGLLDDGTAILELAQASGLPLIESNQKDPARATTRGTGVLVLDALRKGCHHLVFCLGGSATIDGGIGILAELGAQFFDEFGQQISPNPFGLHKLKRLDLSKMDRRILETKVTVLTDVTNPLLGKNGAVNTYGPQKGVSQEEIPFFEDALRNFHTQTCYHLGVDQEKQPGTGAAGGAGYGLSTYLNGRIQTGFSWISAKLRLEATIQETKPHIIITGEGRFDHQSMQGKVVGEMIRLGHQYRIPVIALCGSLQPGWEESKEKCGQFVALSITPMDSSVRMALTNAGPNLRAACLKLSPNILKYHQE